MGPSLSFDMDPVYTYTPGMMISPQFMAKPVPSVDNISWYLMTENQTTLDIHEASEAGVADLVPSELTRANTNNPDEWRADIMIYNLTENVTIWFHVDNGVGFMDKMFQGTVAVYSVLNISF